MLSSKVTLEALPKDTRVRSHVAAPDMESRGSRERPMGSVERGDGWEESRAQRRCWGQ